MGPPLIIQGKRKARTKKVVPPSDRRTRSAGPAEIDPPLPPLRAPRTPKTQEPEPSLVGRLTSIGRSLLFGETVPTEPTEPGPSQPPDPPAGVNLTEPAGTTEDDWEDMWDLSL